MPLPVLARIVPSPRKGGVLAAGSYVGRPRPPRAPVRLFCFPDRQDGLAAFQALAQHTEGAADVWTLDLAGRDYSAGEIASALVPYLDGPFAFLGHREGAWVAFDLIHRLEQIGAPLPTVLFSAAMRAPHCRLRRVDRQRLSEEDFVDELRRVGLQSHPITVPIVALGSTNDPETSFAEVEGWAQHTTSHFDFAFYPGNDYLLHDRVAELWAEIGARLDQ